MPAMSERAVVRRLQLATGRGRPQLSQRFGGRLTRGDRVVASQRGHQHRRTNRSKGELRPIQRCVL
jgi:hypothetical protein